MHALQKLVADVQPQSALRVGFENAAMLPPDGVGRNEALQTAHQAARDHTLHQSAEDAAQPDVHLNDVQRVFVRFTLNLECDISDTHHFPPLAVDDLLVEE